MVKQTLSAPEYSFLKLLRLTASPKRVVEADLFRDGVDASHNPYSFLINKLREKEYIEIHNGKIKILDQTD